MNLGHLLGGVTSFYFSIDVAKSGLKTPLITLGIIILAMIVSIIFAGDLYSFMFKTKKKELSK